MSKVLLTILLALILCSTAAADLYVHIGTSGGAWPQAAYVITPADWSEVPAWMPAQFDTFCVERTVTFTPGTYLATIDDEVLLAGTTGLTVLQDDVKKIYAAYLNLELQDLDENLIQESVWAAQGYGDYSVNGTIASRIADTSKIAGWNDVKVLNLWEDNGGDVQSQLVMTPVPGAGILGVLGLGLASWRLKRRKMALAA